MKQPFTENEKDLLYSLHLLSNGSWSLFEDDFFMYITNILTFWDYPNDVLRILKYTNKTKVDLFGIFKNKLLNLSIDLTHNSLIENPKSFVLITDFGGMNGEYHFASKMYLQTASRHFRSVCPELSVELERRCTGKDLQKIQAGMRSYQLLCLYSIHKYGAEHHPSDYEVILKILWNSIPDPFLTAIEFTKTFEKKRPQFKYIVRAWNWYCKLVRDPADQDKCPRSLKHLSRCAIRERLRDCFQLPDGVQELDIPLTLKPYLLLKDFSTHLASQRVRWKPSEFLFDIPMYSLLDLENEI